MWMEKWTGLFLEDNKVKVTQLQSDRWIDRDINATSSPKVTDWSLGESCSIDLGWCHISLVRLLYAISRKLKWMWV